MSSVVSFRHFIELLIKEVALCGENGASPTSLVENTFATFGIQSLEFLAPSEPLELLQACWDPLLSSNCDVMIAETWKIANKAGQRKHPSLHTAIQQSMLIFTSSHTQLYVLGCRPWMGSYAFSNKYLLALQCIARARHKGVTTTYLLQELGFNPIDLHHHLEVLKSLCVVTSRKCQVIVDGTLSASSLWHLASLAAASMPNFSDSYGGIRVECHAVSDEDLDYCLEILQNAGGTLSVDDFVYQLSRHPRLKEKCSTLKPGTGYGNLEQSLIQHRCVRRVLVRMRTSSHLKVAALQIYDPDAAQLPQSIYPFQLLQNVPLTTQVQSFIHDCGSYGCTSADIAERLHVPKKVLERILSQLNNDEISTTKQCVGHRANIVYISKITFANDPTVSKLQIAPSNDKQEELFELLPLSTRPMPVISRHVPWQHLQLNDVQLNRLDLLFTYLQSNPVVSVYSLFSHIIEQEKPSNSPHTMCYKTLDRLVEILLPFVEATHVQKTIVMSDGVNVRMLMPADMEGNHTAVVEAYKKDCAVKHKMHSKRNGLDKHLGKEPPHLKRRKAKQETVVTEPPVPPKLKRKRRKVSKIVSTDQLEDSDDCSEDSSGSFEKSSPNHQRSYRRLFVVPSIVVKAYMLHSFIVSRHLLSVSADALLGMLPFRILIQIIGIPSLKNSVLFSLFQELRTLPALAMDCNTFPRDALLRFFKKDQSDFAKVWDLLFKLSVLKRRRCSLVSLDGSVALSQEVDVSQSVVIQNVDPETFSKFSNFGCIYYEPSLCVFSLRNSTELRQLWMFFKHLAHDIDAYCPSDPDVQLSLPDSHKLPDILKYGGVFRYSLNAADVKKDPSRWILYRYSGPIVAKLTTILKKTTDLQETLESVVFPRRWLTNVVPQILLHEFYFGGLEIFTEIKKVSRIHRLDQIPLLVDGTGDNDEESEDIQCEQWNLESESKLLAYVLLHHSDKIRPGRILSGQELERLCNRVNWTHVSRFVREPPDSCRTHFSLLVPCSQFATALQAFRDKYPEASSIRTLTTLMAQELAHDIRFKTLLHFDSFCWQDNGQSQARDSVLMAKEPSRVNLPWHASFHDCVAAGLVIKRTFCIDHYDQSVAAAAKYIDSLLPPDRVLAGSSCLATFGATLASRCDKPLASQVLRWSDLPKVVTEKLKIEKGHQHQKRMSVHQKIENFQTGVERLPSTIPHVNSALDAVALSVLHLRGQLSFEHKWHMQCQPPVHSKKVSMSDYLYNQGILKPLDKVLEAADECLDSLDSSLSAFDDTSRLKYHLNGPDVKISSEPRHSIADLEFEPRCWKTDFSPDTVERASSFVQHQAATGVDTRLVCDAVGVDTDDAAAFRRHLLSGVWILF